MSAAPQDFAFAGREKEKDVRYSNIVAARAVADIVRTSLGPKGMDKLITSADGQHIITNDGATIVGKLDTTHPAAKMVRLLFAPLYLPYFNSSGSHKFELFWSMAILKQI